MSCDWLGLEQRCMRLPLLCIVWHWCVELFFYFSDVNNVVLQLKTSVLVHCSTMIVCYVCLWFILPTLLFSLLCLKWWLSSSQLHVMWSLRGVSLSSSFLSPASWRSSWLLVGLNKISEIKKYCLFCWILRCVLECVVWSLSATSQCVHLLSVDSCYRAHPFYSLPTADITDGS